MLNGVYVRFFCFYLEQFINALFGWLVDDFFGRECEFVNSFFDRYHRNTVSANVDTMSTLLYELVSLRDGHIFLYSGCQLTRSELLCIIGCMLLCMLVSSSSVYSILWP